MFQLKRSRQYFKRLQRSLPCGAHYNFHASGVRPVVPFVGGRGARLWDMDGNEHIDLACKYGASIVGHGNNEYNRRLTAQIGQVLGVDQAGLEARVCERLIGHLPSAELVRFGLSGTEVIQNALRLARAFTGRQQILRFVGHYHGSADDVMGGAPRGASDPTPREKEGDGFFTEGRASGAFEAQLLVTWNDVEAIERVFRAQGERLAAVIMEPVALNCGGVVPSADYLRRVRELCDQRGVVLIFDEVITGFRAAIGGAQSVFGVTPDLTILGKALSGGAVPVSALVGRREIMALYEAQRVVHAGTYNGYPLGLAAVDATLDLLEGDPDCYERMGAHLVQLGRVLTDAAEDVGLPLVVQGMPTGLCAHVCPEPLERCEDYTSDLKTRDGLLNAVCEEHGIRLAPGYARLYSNLMLDADDVAFFAGRVHDALKETRSVIEAVRPLAGSSAGRAGRS